MSRPPLHLVITYSLRYASDLMNQAQDSGKLIDRKSHLEGVLADGTHIRCVSYDTEIRGYRPESYQVIWAPNRTNQQRRKVDEMEYYLSMRDVQKKEILS